MRSRRFLLNCGTPSRPALLALPPPQPARVEASKPARPPASVVACGAGRAYKELVVHVKAIVAARRADARVRAGGGPQGGGIPAAAALLASGCACGGAPSPGRPPAAWPAHAAEAGRPRRFARAARGDKTARPDACLLWWRRLMPGGTSCSGRLREERGVRGDDVRGQG